MFGGNVYKEKDSKLFANIEGAMLKQIVLGVKVGEYIVLATEISEVFLVCMQTKTIIDTLHEVTPITAMCHVCKLLVLMSHGGGWLSCWNIVEGKFKQTAMIKSLAAGEVSRITHSPNQEEGEVIMASNRGCIFARVDEKGYIVEELFEMYFNNKPLACIGWYNFKKYFAAPRTAK